MVISSADASTRRTLAQAGLTFQAIMCALNRKIYLLVQFASVVFARPQQWQAGADGRNYRRHRLGAYRRISTKSIVRFMRSGRHERNRSKTALAIDLEVAVPPDVLMPQVVVRPESRMFARCNLQAC